MRRHSGRTCAMPSSCWTMTCPPFRSIPWPKVTSSIQSFQVYFITLSAKPTIQEHASSKLSWRTFPYRKRVFFASWLKKLRKNGSILNHEMPNKWRIREFKDSRRGEICTGKTEAYWISSGSIQMSDHHCEKPENTFLAKKGISFLRKGIWSYPITVQNVLLKRE